MPKPLHISIVALPETSVSILLGLYDVLNSFQLLHGFSEVADRVPRADMVPFKVEIVGAEAGQHLLAGRTPTIIHRGIGDLDTTDIVIVSAVIAEGRRWETGRYPEMVNWLQKVHERGALLCSACSGILLLAETGLFDGRKSTIHWSYADFFRELFPKIPLSPEQALIVAGDRGQFITSGAAASWHDLALYLIARHVDPAAAQVVAKFFALQWHHEGQGPYMVFEGRQDHGDAAILDIQNWLATHFSVADPVDEAVRRSGMAERTFKRRFANATGHAPLAYVQLLRIEEAKRRLERTGHAIEEIGWQVGYEDPAFFRRLFKRLTGISPGQYRKQFQIPDYAAGPRPEPATV
jgi:transcriptional regulator GlxA family with amidase domain